MGQKEVTGKKYPHKEANRITKFLDLGLTGSVRFPVDVKQVALELTPSFNTDPITAVRGDSFKSIDGALVRHSNEKEWGILYNTEIVHPGRVNFTLAHELGHYMVHRHTITSDRIECGQRDMLDENSGQKNIEAEANTFAANLLMPNHDFRDQADGQPFSFDMMSHCADRYGVSLTAAVLKWLDFTKRRAIALLSEEGGMHWSKSTDKAFRSGRYFATRQGYNEVPETSMAAQERFSWAARDGVRHGPGIWFDNEEVVEHSVYSEEYGKTLTVLILDDIGGYDLVNDEAEEAELITDTYTNFINNGQKSY